MSKCRRVLGQGVMKRRLSSLTNETIASKIVEGIEERFPIEHGGGLVFEGFCRQGDDIIRSAVFVSGGKGRRVYFGVKSGLDGSVLSWGHGFSYVAFNKPFFRRSKDFFRDYNDFVNSARWSVVEEIDKVGVGSVLRPYDDEDLVRLKGVIEATYNDIGDITDIKMVPRVEANGGVLFNTRRVAYEAGADRGVILFERDFVNSADSPHLLDDVALIWEKKEGSVGD